MDPLWAVSSNKLVDNSRMDGGGDRLGRNWGGLQIRWIAGQLLDVEDEVGGRLIGRKSMDAEDGVRLTPGLLLVQLLPCC